jgi:hypothetical protein
MPAGWETERLVAEVRGWPYEGCAAMSTTGSWQLVCGERSRVTRPAGTGLTRGRCKVSAETKPRCDRYPARIAGTGGSTATRDVRPERPRARDCHARSERTEHESNRRPPLPRRRGPLRITSSRGNPQLAEPRGESLGRPAAFGRPAAAAMLGRVRRASIGRSREEGQVQWIYASGASDSSRSSESTRPWTLVVATSHTSASSMIA